MCNFLKKLCWKIFLFHLNSVVAGITSLDYLNVFLNPKWNWWSIQVELILFFFSFFINVTSAFLKGREKRILSYFLHTYFGTVKLKTKRTKLLLCLIFAFFKGLKKSWKLFLSRHVDVFWFFQCSEALFDCPKKFFYKKMPNVRSLNFISWQNSPLVTP